MSDTTPNHKGRSLIEAFERAVTRRNSFELHLECARKAEHEATADLAQWLAPADAKPGENFGIWERDQHGNEVLYRVVITTGGRSIEKRRR